MSAKKILISGAGSGLGQAMAIQYAAQGAEVCVADINDEGGAETVSRIEQSGGHAFFIHCDITQQWDVDKLAIKLAERWQSLDVLVNNAGIATAGSIESESMQQWQSVIDINLLGHVRMTKGMLSLLRNSNSSERAIINIASQAGITAGPNMGSYCVTKASVVSYSEVAYLELAPEGIHVAVACPAFLDTNLNRSLQTDDPNMQLLVNKLIKKSGVTADEIAQRILVGVDAKKFMIITHKDGRQTYRLKRFLPIDRYLKMALKRLQKFSKKST